jgi:hypothetical protein
MQPLPFIFIQQDIFAPQTGTAHFYFGSANYEFRKSGKPGIAPLNLPREDHVRRISSEYSSY